VAGKFYPLPMTGQQKPVMSDRQHFMQCRTCGEWFDMRNLDEVFKHETDHKDRPDIQYAGSKRVS
jgi:hypothetical protein